MLKGLVQALMVFPGWFSSNSTIHLVVKFSPFEIVYGFNPLTPLKFLPLPIDERASTNEFFKENGTP